MLQPDSPPPTSPVHPPPLSLAPSPSSSSSLSFFQPLPTCGDPPWCVFLWRNIAPEATKKTEIRIHSHPNVLEFTQNHCYATNREIWHVVMCVSGFTQWDKVVHFTVAWQRITRGLRSRIKQGIILFYTFADKESLDLYCSFLTPIQLKQQVTQFLQRKDCVFGILSECYQQEEKKKKKKNVKKKTKKKKRTSSSSSTSLSSSSSEENNGSSSDGEDGDGDGDGDGDRDMVDVDNNNHHNKGKNKKALFAITTHTPQDYQTLYKWSNGNLGEHTTKTLSWVFHTANS